MTTTEPTRPPALPPTEPGGRHVRVLVTGSRNWEDRATMRKAMAEVAREFTGHMVTLVHGDAPGADTMAAELAVRMGFWVEAHPARWNLFGRAAGPRRNQEMVDLGADVCLAFPHPDSRGTYDCMNRADKAGIEVRVFHPRNTNYRQLPP